MVDLIAESDHTVEDEIEHREEQHRLEQHPRVTEGRLRVALAKLGLRQHPDEVARTPPISERGRTLDLGIGSRRLGPGAQRRAAAARARRSAVSPGAAGADRRHSLRATEKSSRLGSLIATVWPVAPPRSTWQAAR